MSEDIKDPIKMKKDILSSHIPFIQKMLEKVKNTEFEKKWQQMYDCIMSDKKKLNIDQISKMNKTILGLKCKMQQIEPKKENIQLKIEQVESTSVNNFQLPKPSLEVKTEIKVITEKSPKNILESQISLQNPPLSNDDITQLLVETAESPILHQAPAVNVVPINDETVFGKLNGNEAETMESIEGFMKHIHEQDSITKVNKNEPSTSKKETLKDVSKSPKKTGSKNSIEPVPRKSSILLPSPSFEVALSSVVTKAYKIPKLSKPNIPSKAVSPIPVISKNKKVEPRARPKRRISSTSTSSSKLDEPTEKKLKPKKRNIILDSESSGEDNKVVKPPVKSKTVKIKAKEPKLIAKSVEQPEKCVKSKKKNGEMLKNLVGKLPDSGTDIPETSDLILSLENLVGKNGLKKMKSIIVNSTDVVNKPTTSSNVEQTVELAVTTKKRKLSVEKTAKRTLPNLENSKSVKKQKMIDEICNAVVKEEKTISPKCGYKKKNELERLNADIDNMFIRDAVLKANGKRACTVKSYDEISLSNSENMSQLKGCFVILHRLELNLEDKPFNINNFPLQIMNSNVTVVKTLDTTNSPIESVTAKVALAKKPKLKKKTKKNKPRTPWTRLACKKLELKDEEWEDVEDDQEGSKSSSPVVIMEQNVPDTAKIINNVADTTESIKNVIESIDKVETKNSNEIEPKITQQVQEPVSNSTEIPTTSISTNKVKDTHSISNCKLFVIPFKKVFNLSYSILNCGTVYKCSCGDCKFQTIVKPAFISHLNENHMTVAWNGYCEICNKQVQFENKGELEKLFIINEYLHMFEMHISHESPVTTGELLQNAGNSKDKLGFVNSPTFMPKITVGTSSYSTNTKTIGGSIVGKIIPMVKVPMNYIMTTNLKTETKESGPKASSVVKCVSTPQPALLPLSIRPTVIKAPASTSWTQTVINAPKELSPTTMIVKPVMENMTYVIYDNKPNDTLRPWLPAHTVLKNRQLCKEMLSEICLVAIFKCMATTCNYYTNDEKYFRKHLKAHLQFQTADKSNFLKCAYCPLLGSSIDSLVVHIKCAHRYDKYQCPYCFYRTVVDFNVLTHMDLFHKMKPKSIVVCTLTLVKNYVDELETIKKTRANFVPPIVCVFCKSKFYVFKTFITHVNSHKETCNTKCIKCNETTNKLSLHKHLVNCHGFGLFQCVYCKFGTNTFEIINHHLTNLHPNKLPMFCERSQAQSSVKIPVSSIDSTCLKHINQVVNSNLIRKPIYPERMLLNHGNVGILAKNLLVQMVFDSQTTKTQSKDRAEDGVLFKTLENDPKLLNHQEEEPLDVQDTFITFVDPAKPPIASTSNGDCKLQIKSVFSLHNYSQNN